MQGLGIRLAERGGAALTDEMHIVLGGEPEILEQHGDEPFHVALLQSLARAVIGGEFRALAEFEVRAGGVIQTTELQEANGIAIAGRDHFAIEPDVVEEHELQEPGADARAGNGWEEGKGGGGADAFEREFGLRLDLAVEIALGPTTGGTSVPATAADGIIRRRYVVAGDFLGGIAGAPGGEAAEELAVRRAALALVATAEGLPVIQKGIGQAIGGIGRLEPGGTGLGFVDEDAPIARGKIGSAIAPFIPLAADGGDGATEARGPFEIERTEGTGGSPGVSPSQRRLEIEDGVGPGEELGLGGVAQARELGVLIAWN